MSVQDVAVFDPIQANDIDAELERSLTNEWDAKIMTYPNERFPFNEWMLNRIRMMGFSVEDLSFFHEVVPQAVTERDVGVAMHAFAVGAAVTDRVRHPFQQRRRATAGFSCSEARYSAHSASNLARGIGGVCFSLPKSVS